MRKIRLKVEKIVVVPQLRAKKATPNKVELEL